MENLKIKFSVWLENALDVVVSYVFKGEINLNI